MEHILLFIPSGGEFMVIVFLALLFFGADAIPGLARTVGKGMREFKKATDDIKMEFENHTSDIKEELTKMTGNIEKKGLDIKRKIDEELKD